MSQTMNERLEAYLVTHPNEWIDGLCLATVCGSYAWRSRVSDMRVYYGMTIENRQRRYQWHEQDCWSWGASTSAVPCECTCSKPTITKSFYRYVPAQQESHS